MPHLFCINSGFFFDICVNDVLLEIRFDFIFQRYPALSHLLPTWFVDQLVMFSYKNSPLPTAAPEPEDDD